MRFYYFRQAVCQKQVQESCKEQSVSSYTRLMVCPNSKYRNKSGFYQDFADIISFNRIIVQP